MAEMETIEDGGLGDGQEMHAVVGLTEPTFSALTFHPDAYRDLVAEEGWSQDQEDAYLAALWSIIVGFVDLGFRIHPTQQVLGTENMLADPLANVVDSLKISDSFNSFAAAHHPENFGDRAAE